MPDVFTNREWAMLIWSAVLLIFVLGWAQTRPLIRDILRVLGQLLGQPKILALLLGFATYVGCLVLLAKAVGMWRTDLAGTTSLWFVVSGLVLLFQSTRVSEETGFVGHTFRRAVGIAALLEGFGSLYVFSLPVELLLIIPFVVIVSALAALADVNDQAAPAGPPARRMLALLGIGFLAYVSIHVASDWSGPHLSQDLRLLALPLWLTVGVLPFIYVAGLLMAYEQSFMRLTFYSWADRRTIQRAKLALLAGVNFRARRLGYFTAPWPYRLLTAPDFRSASRIARQIGALDEGASAE